MNFRKDLEEDTVRSLQLRQAILISPHTVVRAAVALMRRESLGCAVIVDHRRVPSGIFTEHSLIGALVKNASLDDCPVCQFADRNFISVGESEPIMRVWQAVQLAAARFVCVTDADGRAIGITGQRGLAEYLTDCFARQVTVQRLGSKPWMQQREGA